jgi:hypothetical protein
MTKELLMQDVNSIRIPIALIVLAVFCVVSVAAVGPSLADSGATVDRSEPLLVCPADIAAAVSAQTAAGDHTTDVALGGHCAVVTPEPAISAVAHPVFSDALVEYIPGCSTGLLDEPKEHPVFGDALAEYIPGCSVGLLDPVGTLPQAARYATADLAAGETASSCPDGAGSNAFGLCPEEAAEDCDASGLACDGGTQVLGVSPGESICCSDAVVAARVEGLAYQARLRAAEAERREIVTDAMPCGVIF